MKKINKAESLEQIVGEQVYSVWMDMLSRLVPDGRTHRLAPTIAAMLQYTAVLALEKNAGDLTEGTATWKLVHADESGEDEAEEMLMPIVKRLFKDAGVEYQRTSASGEKYSVATEAIREYVDWFNMPWE